jgi:predicted alpha/beta superfamily hydrolase
LFSLLSTRAFSTRQKDYNDPSIQNLRDEQQGDNSDQPGGSQAFNLEAEFHKLQKLVKSKAKEIAALKKKE